MLAVLALLDFIQLVLRDLVGRGLHLGVSARVAGRYEARAQRGLHRVLETVVV